eukprot:CAMPEP_0119158748 /NCGR_PEP_ID=MMETSP1310-20130426/53417_1 /TAXON_ID=464262 /ORGANISM="Genus nov. species nov., Strain RCC2339" /LENGTH=170 /DNA_ID=CAMNT_0007151373 /DNA_START=292 /DNA_END=804 /DNA_ORIENTATION=+
MGWNSSHSRYFWCSGSVSDALLQKSRSSGFGCQCMQMQYKELARSISMVHARSCAMRRAPMYFANRSQAFGMIADWVSNSSTVASTLQTALKISFKIPTRYMRLRSASFAAGSPILEFFAHAVTRSRGVASASRVGPTVRRTISACHIPSSLSILRERAAKARSFSLAEV